ncbi:MAG: hypothetical protein OEX02_15220 [Cyclobacteriaceae bacterium]|nr:hypothetical protein [Cyclobacteriaceae bacterium]
MEKQQVKQRIQTNIYQFHEKGYDTIYLLMNGIGIAGTLNRLPAFLKHLTSLLKPGGQLLFDSSDISYLYVGKDKPRNYYGEVRYQYKYNEEKGLWFNWLYVDPQTLMDVGQKHHFNVQVISEDDTGQYLARVNV